MCKKYVFALSALLSIVNLKHKLKMVFLNCDLFFPEKKKKQISI